MRRLPDPVPDDEQTALVAVEVYRRYWYLVTEGFSEGEALTMIESEYADDASDD